MKNRFHVFSRMFTKMNVFLFLLFALLATSAWGQVYLDLKQDSNGDYYIELPLNYDGNGDFPMVEIPNNVTTFKVYDNNAGYGANLDKGYYRYPEQGSSTNVFILFQAPEGKRLKLTGKIATAPSDYVFLYSSFYDQFPLFGESGSNDNIGPYYTANNTGVISMTFAKLGEGGDLYGTLSNYEGFELTVDVTDPESYGITINNVTGGTVTTETGTTTAIAGDEVKLTVSPDEGYLLKSIKVMAGNREIEVHDVDFLSNIATFLMPGSSVSVTPTYTKAKTAEEELSLNLIDGMPGLYEYYQIPDDVKSFHVYDNGGANGDMIFMWSGVYGYDYLALQAPKGKTLQVTGHINLPVKYYQEYDYYAEQLALFANHEDAYKYADPYSTNTKNLALWTGNGVKDNIGTHVSADGKMVITFLYDLLYYGAEYLWGKSMGYPGFDLVVSVVDIPEPKIEVVGVNGGTVSCSSENPKPNEEITLEITPNENNLLYGIEVKDANGRIIEVHGGEWYSENPSKATFIMPASDVVVTPKFTSDLTAEGGLYVNMPLWPENASYNDKIGVTVNIPTGVKSFKVYDNGGTEYGPSGGFFYLKLFAPENSYMQVTGRMSTYESSQDLIFFDKDSTSFWKQDGDDDNLFAVNKSNKMYIAIDSRAYGYERSFEGVDLTVSVGSADAHTVKVVQPDEGGTLTVSNTSVLPGEMVSVSANLEDGYLFGGLIFKDATGNVVGSEYSVAWYSNTATFVMPILDVYVTPIFKKTLTADDGIFVNLPTTGSKKIVVPAGVSSFKVYDDGGRNSRFSHGELDGTYSFCSADGSVFQVTGTMNAWASTLSIYDGENVDSKKELLSLKTGSTWTENIGSYTSFSQCIAINFKSPDHYSTQPGIDLTVTLIAPPVGDVIVNSATGGSVETVASAKMGDVVTLTIKPNEGYLLSGLTVKDANEKTVALDSLNSFLGSTTFTMPATSVTVTPSFTNDFTAEGGLFVNMNRKRTSSGFAGELVVIPDNVTSFKVYDDGGKDGNYSNEASSQLIMGRNNMSDGYHLVLSGTLNTVDCNNSNPDTLTIMHGFEKLLDHACGDEVVVPPDTSNIFIFKFGSNSANNASGFEFTVKVIPPGVYVIDPEVGGTTVVDKSAAVPGTKVTATVTPSKGYYLSDMNIHAKYAIGWSYTDVDISWETNTATFTMIPADVAVRTKFATSLTAEGGLFVNMPDSGQKTVRVPASVTSFMVHDAGGGEGTALPIRTNGKLTFVAPMGYSFRFTGKVEIGSTEVVEVTYGDESVHLKSTDDLGSNGLFTSNQVTLEFNADRKRVGNVAGFDLKVELVAPYVNIASVSGGSMTCDNYLAVNGETVTLTAAPDDGYVLEGVEVKDAEGNVVAVTDGKWYSKNKASFRMPSGTALVTPKFTNELTNLYVMIPNGFTTLDVAIPASVKSFKVYDDGGKNGDYGKDVHGRLNIAPPEDGSATALTISGEVAILKDDQFSITSHLMIIGRTFYVNDASADGKLVNIGTYTNTAALYIVFDSYANTVGTAAGLDLTVTTVPVEYQVNGAVSVIHDDAGLWTDGNEDYKVLGLVQCEADNKVPAKIYKDVTVDTAVIYRSFPEKTYSTVVLPFDVNTDNLEGLDAVLSYNGIGKDKDGNDAIRMKVVWATEKWVEDNQIKDASGQLMTYTAANLTANTPYLIQMGQERLVVKGKVTFKQTEKADVSKDGWTFRGTWVYKIWNDDNDSELGYAYGFAASSPEGSNISVGDFVRVGKGAWINPMRAYLIRDDKAAPQGIRANGNYVMRPSVARQKLPELMSIVIDNDGDASGEQTTVIGHFNTRTGEFKMNRNAGARTYDLKGRYVGDKANKARGAYYGKNVKK